LNNLQQVSSVEAQEWDGGDDRELVPVFIGDYNEEYQAESAINNL